MANGQNRDDDYEWDYQQWKGNKLQELKYHRAICMMICGANLGDVAKELGTTKRTVQRYFNSPEFNDNLTRAIQITFKNALSRASLFADRAVQILIEIAEDINQPTKYRLQAISQITDICFKAELQQPTRERQPDVDDRMYHQTKLLSSYNTVKSLGREIENSSISDRLNEENQKGIWSELYPDEPYPSEKTMRKHFDRWELGLDEEDKEDEEDN